jgi:3-oxoacyl-[acyl-carrier-protein] synthase II
MTTPRAITGVGIASAFGTGMMASFVEALTDAAKGKLPPTGSPIASFDASAYPSNPPIVEVPAFDPTKYLGDKGLRTLDRLTKLLVVAARLSLHDAGIKKDNQWALPEKLGADRVGVCCSNAYGSLEAIHELDRVAVLEDARYINPAKFPNTVSNSASGYVSIWEDLRALNVSVSDGNCGAFDAVACADIFLATDRADAILTGGGEAMSEALYLAFDKLGVLSEKSKLGEGAAFLMLETTEAAAARGANVLARVTGYGTAFIAPPKESDPLLFASPLALERAIKSALEDAKIGSVSDVDLVISGVAGFSYFDRHELRAIDQVLGDKVPIASPKREFFGESLGAGGALAMATATAWLQGAPVSCLTRGSVTSPPKTILLTSVGYYGNASALVMQR